MFTNNETFRKIVLALMLAVFPLFAACGGGGDDEDEPASTSSSSDSSGSLCMLMLLFLADPTSCLASQGGGTSSGGSTSPPPPPPPPSSGTIRILGQNDLEPNDTQLNAQIVNFSSSTEDKVGFTVDGAISDVSDQADYFTFVRPRARDLRFQLCPEDQMICERGVPIDTLTAWIDVLDQDGNILASTQADDFNMFVMRIEAGLPYYVRVAAGDTMGTAVGYALTVYETN